ncbi:Hypothetical predicted protein [Paramuricea clavata]|uniref:Uncharacterized protein n=1 Tax=Paramuricea clavata TaxID=317549 RepID=A0A6S7GN21_PARCT|nr:Hypothetical predicted protein [Paramuricea clavata]
MGKPQEPVAKRTSLGWMAVRLVGKPRGDIHSYHVASAEPEQLDVAFKQFWDSESFGTKTTNLPHYSNDDQRALDILEHETRKLETGYEVLLLWKENEPQLQNNREVAQKRLEGLQRRFERDPEYEKDYRKAVSKDPYVLCCLGGSFRGRGLFEKHLRRWRRTVLLPDSQTKVAPKKALSVASLELQAALLGARLASYVKEAMTRHIDRVFFWTDSKCVIGWIRSTAVWYKPFVAHRVGEIQTLTDPKSCRHVPGRLNVSDCATRSRFDERSELIPVRWFTVPDFLYRGEDNWPKEMSVEELQQHEEIKPSKIFVAKSNPECVPVYADIDLERFSSLSKAQRVAALVHRFFNVCKGKKPESSVVTVQDSPTSSNPWKERKVSASDPNCCPLPPTWTKIT